jgi:hypothetical protein
MDLVHLIGALGCLALTGGFAGQGEIARAVFYGLCTMAFAVGFAHRVTHRHREQAPTVIDLRESATTPAVGKVARPH